jgi:DNA-binding response OmpR family regulator
VEGAAMVLIADDDADIRELIAEILRTRDFEVEAVSDGRFVLEFVHKRRPCLLLLDLMMPGVSGWEVAEQMRADRTLSTVPICVITAASVAPPRGVRVLRKPLDLGELLNTARECRKCRAA